MKGARLPAPHIFVLHPFSFKTNIKSPKYAGNHFCPLYFQVVNCNPVCALRLSLWTITVAKKSATRDCWDDRHPPPSHLTCSFSFFFFSVRVFFFGLRKLQVCYRLRNLFIRKLLWCIRVHMIRKLEKFVIWKAYSKFTIMEELVLPLNLD